MIDHDRYAGIYSTCWCRRKVSSNMTHDISLISCWHPSILLFYSAQCPVCGHLRNCLAAEILDGLIMKFRLIRFHRFHRLKNLEHQVCYFHIFSWFPHVVSSIFMFFFMQAGIPHIPEIPTHLSTKAILRYPQDFEKHPKTTQNHAKLSVYVPTFWHNMMCVHRGTPVFVGTQHAPTQFVDKRLPSQELPESEDPARKEPGAPIRVYV